MIVNQTTSQEQNLVSQLKYRSLHRGTKELDIIFERFILSGEFAKIEGDGLKVYQKFLDEDDYDIYDWIVKKKVPPSEYERIVEAMQYR